MECAILPQSADKHSNISESNSLATSELTSELTSLRPVRPRMAASHTNRWDTMEQKRFDWFPQTIFEWLRASKTQIYASNYHLWLDHTQGF